MAKVKAFSHIFKIIGISLLNTKAKENSKNLMLSVVLIKSNYLESSGANTIVMKRKLVNEYNLSPGSVIKITMYGSKEDLDVDSSSNISVKATGFRIEKWEDEMWNRLVDSMGKAK